MINQQAWLTARKNLLKQVKAQVRVRLGPPSRILGKYSKDLDREFQSGWKDSSWFELSRTLARANVVLGADFHAYAQAQKAHVRILRDRLEHSRQVILALECVNYKKEKAIDRYLRGQISERKFLQDCGWNNDWGFPWEHYRPIFELARENGYKICGLGNAKIVGLNARDNWMSQRIADISASSPEALIYVIVGEAHLAKGHLPIKLKKYFARPESLVTLFQDVEKLYFKLAGRKKPSVVEVFKRAGNRYCIMVSPPWMRWQSYLMFLEQTYDRELFDEVIIDYSDHLASLIEILQTELGIGVSKSRIQVYGPNSKRSILKIDVGLSERSRRVLFYHLENDISFFLPETEYLYLSRATINHAATLSGQFIHASLSKRKRNLWNFPDDFLALIWIEAVGFFFSKWINPQRKADTLESVRLQMQARIPKDAGRKALELALDHRLTEVLWVKSGRLRESKFAGRNYRHFLEASHLLGTMMGERLFQKVRSRAISLNRLKHYLRANIEGKDFFDFYWRLIREIESDQIL